MLELAHLKLMPDAAGTRQSAKRRHCLSSAYLEIPRVALEVGAFDNPTLRASDGFEVRYADYFSAEELKQKWAGNPRRRFDHVVDVDYVIKGPKLSPFIHDTIDLVVANHVIEHIPDPIGWLCDLATFCSPNASIFLAVPDLRFTFDIHKQPSDVSSLVRAHEERKAQPDAYDVARMRHLHARVDAAAMWAGEDPPVRSNRTGKTYRELLEQGRAEVAKGYFDVHCHFYTSGSFVEIFVELLASHYIPWKVELLRDVEPGGKEFYALLRHQGNA